MYKFTSCQAPNADFVCAAITDYVAARLSVPTEFINRLPWQERERLFDAGEIQVCWICGLPYVWKADQPDANVELLVAPIMQGERYAGQPVYFSDVVVHRESRFQSFADLRGASWSYNEPHSHSGYNLVCYHLASLGEDARYFGTIVEAGSHQASLQMILDGRVDASAIDSTVLELEIQLNPAMAKQIRILATLGPSPIPPWVISRKVPVEFRQSLRHLLLQMHLDYEGRRILDRGQIARFVRVQDSDYDEIRRMAHLAAQVSLRSEIRE